MLDEQLKDDVAATQLTKAARDKLKQIVAQIERAEEEKKQAGEGVKGEYAAAKAMGYDTKALRKLVKLRKKDRQEREQEDAILETYMLAVGEL